MKEHMIDDLTSFIKTTIAPLLVWKAGRNAESIRTMATQALYSISCACAEAAYEIYPQLAKHFISLVEDDVAVTRAYALRCVLKCGPFCYEDYRQLTIGMHWQCPSCNWTFQRCRVAAVHHIELFSYNRAPMCGVWQSHYSIEVFYFMYEVFGCKLVTEEKCSIQSI